MESPYLYLRSKGLVRRGTETTSFPGSSPTRPQGPSKRGPWERGWNWEAILLRVSNEVNGSGRTLTSPLKQGERARRSVMDGVWERGGTPAIKTPSFLMLEIKIPSCTVSSKPITIVDVLWKALRELTLARARTRIYHHSSFSCMESCFQLAIPPPGYDKSLIWIFFSSQELWTVHGTKSFSTFRLWEVSLKTNSRRWNHGTKAVDCSNLSAGDVN